MKAYVLLDCNGEAFGIPGVPVVIINEDEAQRVWAGWVLEAIENRLDRLEVPLAEVLELGSTLYLDGEGVELRSWLVEAS